MEFEEMKVIWDSQSQEKLYVIDEEALFGQIRRKSRSVNHLVGMVEWVMIAINLLVGIVLVVDTWRGAGPAYEYAFPALYFIYFAIAVYAQQTRKRAEVGFASTLLGELEKALWQVNQLIRQARRMILWYLLPIVAVGSVVVWLNGKPLWSLAMLLLLPATYFASGWEINKFYLPKKESLESLRETLLAEPNQ